MKPGNDNLIVRDGVYPPSEDTYLLLDSIELDSNDVFLEVGCAAGLVSLTAAKIARKVISVDIMFLALQNTRENLLRNDLLHRCSLIQTDLLASVIISEEPTVIAFNPPYLPKDGEESEIDLATVGGQAGQELTLRFLQYMSDFNGTLYLICSSLTDMDLIRTKLIVLGFDIEVVASKKFFFETIQVIKATRGSKESVL